MLVIIVLAVLLVGALLCFPLSRHAAAESIELRDRFNRADYVSRMDQSMLDESETLARGTRYTGVGLLAVFVIVLGLQSVHVVRATDVGVPVSFGTVGEPLQPGVRLTAPWTDVETYPTRPLAVEFCASVNTKDAASVTPCVQVRWSVSKDNANKTYYQARTGDDEEIGKSIVSPAGRQALGEVWAQVPNTEAVARVVPEHPAGSGLDQKGSMLEPGVKMSDIVRAQLATLLDRYGIEVTSVAIREIKPDKTVAAAIANRAAQAQKTQQAILAQQTAIEEGKARKLEAEGLRAALGQLPPLTAEQQQQALCVQAWERQLSAGRTVYDSPCGTGAGASPVTAAR